MKCVVAGGYGFLGRGIVRALLADGHEVIGAGRDVALGERLMPDIPWIYCDFNHDLNPDLWAERLEDVDVVINAVGILQSDLKDDAEMVHGEGARALFMGAEFAGVKRFVHISATTLDGAKLSNDTPGKSAPENSVPENNRPGAGENRPDYRDDDEDDISEYSSSKLTGEVYLTETGLNWTIVRADLVLGRGSMGGGALMQGLAGLPFFVPVPAPGDQKFQPIMLDDLSLGIARMVGPDGALEVRDDLKGQTIYAVGPEVLPLSDIIQSYRRWLGFKPAAILTIPRLLMKPLMWLGDIAALLGNRGPVRSTSLQQMDRFRPHDATVFEAIVGRKLEDLPSMLSLDAATIAARQFARIYFILPMLRSALGLWWIFEGFEGLQTVASLQEFMNLTLPWHSYVNGVLGVLSILCGLMFLSRPWMRLGGSIKLMMLLLLGGMNLSYVSSFQTFMGWGLSLLMPVLLILLLMGLYEKR